MNEESKLIPHASAILPVGCSTGNQEAQSCEQRHPPCKPQQPLFWLVVDKMKNAPVYAAILTTAIGLVPSLKACFFDATGGTTGLSASSNATASESQGIWIGRSLITALVSVCAHTLVHRVLVRTVTACVFFRVVSGFVLAHARLGCFVQFACGSLCFPLLH
jgi:hypothetical protein